MTSLFLWLWLLRSDVWVVLVNQYWRFAPVERKGYKTVKGIRRQVVMCQTTDSLRCIRMKVKCWSR